MESEEDAKESLREVPEALISLAVCEWRSRTTYGRVLYPFWLAYAAVVWATLFAFLAMFLMPRWVNAGIDAVLAEISRYTPEVHEDE